MMSNIRSGVDVLIAAAFQTTQGEDITTFDDADILRFVDATGIDVGQTVEAQQGTTGTAYELDTATLVTTNPKITGTLKAGPENIDLFMKSFLSLDPDVVGSVHEYDGWNGQIDDDKFLTFAWSDKFETVTVKDVWTRKLGFRSTANTSMHLEIEGIGRSADKTDSDLLAGNKLINLDNYSHKESFFYDELSQTPSIAIALISFELDLEQNVGVISANATSPTFVHKDGRIMVKGRLRARLYDDTASWIDRILDLTRAQYHGVWTTGDGRQLDIILRNVVLEGDITPRVSEDGKMDDFEVAFTARQLGVAMPFTVKVEV